MKTLVWSDVVAGLPTVKGLTGQVAETAQY
jgi:hypothetical protein